MTWQPLPQEVDVVVCGAGHNGLVAAALLARRRLRVLVLEDKEVIGGAVRTERPFMRAPKLGASTGSYLFGLMPPEIIAELGIDLPLVRRDPHYFLPSLDGRYLLFGSDEAAVEQQIAAFFSPQDAAAHRALQTELAALRDDIGPTWLAEPLSIEETAERHVRPALRRAFVDLCRGSVGDYLGRFGFKSDLIQAMYAVTDGFSGLCGTWSTPGTGMNFLLHNMCRLPGAGGTWMIVAGGMGTLAARIADVALAAGARIETGCRVARISTQAGVTTGVVLADGSEIRARIVVCNADPFRMQEMVGRDALPPDYNARIDEYRLDGTTLKVNLALRGLPRFSCLPEPRGQHGATMHLLPAEGDVIATLERGFADVMAGRLAEWPSIEWYIHTAVDPSLMDAEGHHNSALFVQWAPYRLAESTWSAEEDRYVDHLLSICDRFAPGTSSLVVDRMVLHPQRIEEHFGMTRGHIHHVDNSFGFADRLPYATPVGGLYSCSAGTHPGGAVIGAGGRNAAHRVMADLDLR